MITPCVLPLVPGYLSAVSAVEVERLGERGSRRGGSSIASIPFIAGFTRRLRRARRRRGGDREHVDEHDADEIAGFVLVVLGLAFVGLLPWPERIAGAGARPPRAPRRLGACCSAAPSPSCAAPCIGTVLASILVLASSSGGVARGVILLLAYSLGLGAAFVVAGVAFAHAMRAFRWVRSHYQRDPDRLRRRR